MALELPATEENINAVYKQHWDAVDNLKAQHGTIHFINVNRGMPIRRRVARTTFAFDHAVACISEKDLKRIRGIIKKYRSVKFERKGDSTRAYRFLEQIEKVLEKYPHDSAGWL